ncbi:MAG: response regulator [Rhodobiaceae bacterium]|nr:response regulator [Rhodobiaceae bacterium]MCC0056861.1 response regulator [Rhodobiaceae bacterium]
MSTIGDENDSRHAPDANAILRHELLTPLTGIVGIAELLIEKAEGRERRHLEGLIAAARGMVSVIAGIGGTPEDAGDEATADLGVMLSGMAGFAEARAAVKGLRTTTEIEGEFPSVPRGTLGALHQVLINLIDNAVKYTDSGAVAFRASCRPDDAGRSRLVVAVSDTGRGIARSEIERIMAPGVRGESAQDRQGWGIGLGVAATELKQLGGQISVESGIGEGSTFTVSLELDAAPLPRRIPDADVPVPPAARVLIADDNAINRRLIGEILRRLGYQVALAEDGREALQMAASVRFDAIVMDIEMPGMDGIEATRALRARPRDAAVPVIALTAHGAENLRLDANTGLFDDIVAKPIDTVALDASLRLALATRRDRKASA